MTLKDINTKKFRKMITEIGAGPGCIIQIDILLEFASEQLMKFGNASPINMIRNALRQKNLIIHDILTNYILKYSNLSIDKRTGYLKKDMNKILAGDRPDFQSWVAISYDTNALSESIKLQIGNGNDVSLFHNNSQSKQRISKETKGNRKLILISRRGKRLDEDIICSNCGRVGNLAWRYSKSSKGEVTICCICKPKIFERSFDRKDAMDYAKLGGGFESNRRKH